MLVRFFGGPLNGEERDLDERQYSGSFKALSLPPRTYDYRQDPMSPVGIAPEVVEYVEYKFYGAGLPWKVFAPRLSRPVVCRKIMTKESYVLSKIRPEELVFSHFREDLQFDFLTSDAHQVCTLISEYAEKEVVEFTGLYLVTPKI